jgi:hypothetical protein
VELDLAHLERRRVRVPQQIPDEPAVLVHFLGAGAIRHPRRLHDRPVVSHVIDNPDEAVVEDRERHAENGVQCFDPRTGQTFGRFAHCLMSFSAAKRLA